MNLIFSILILFSALCNPADQEPDEILIAEKVYLHTDRDYYYSGDDLWFKAYVIDASTNILSKITRNLHVELISPESEILQTRVIRIDDGIGNGDFNLPFSYPSGNYTIRSYTNLMRNFDDSFFFKKEIIVINPDDTGNERADSIRYIENMIDIAFFPEGGSLVDGITSQVAFKAVDGLGKGCLISGELFSSSGDMLADFQSNDKGIGVFNLNPVRGESYYTVIKNNEGKELRSGLPKSFPTGVTMKVLIIEGNMILRLSANDETLPSIIDREFICTFSSRNLITKKTSLRINSLVNNYLIPVNDFPEGIIRVTVSETNGLPFCERLVFLKQDGDANLTVSADKVQYSPREHVVIKVSIPDASANPEKTYLSLSAVESDLLQDPLIYSGTIASWFLLESDVHGPVENPSWYFDLSNENRLKELDLLLLTQGWRDFQWKYDSKEFHLNEAGFSISGRLRKVLSNKPVGKAKINIGFFGKTSFSFITTETDSDGKYGIGGLDFTGKAKVIVTALDNKDKSGGWLFVDSSRYEPPYLLPLKSQTKTKLLTPSRYSELKQEAFIKIANQKKYNLSDTIDIGEVYIVGKRPDTPQEARIKMGRSRYGNPDKELVITPDMERFPDILKAINGRIPGIWINEGIDPASTIIAFRGESMIVLRDGIPTSVREVQSIPVSMIDRVDVLHWSPSFWDVTPEGMIGGKGVINFITKTGSENNDDAKPLFNSTSLNMRGFDAPRIYYSPVHDIREQTAYMPDSRSTIHWEPNITIENTSSKTIQYYNADMPTSITVSFEGITATGIPVSGKTTYIVK